MPAAPSTRKLRTAIGRYPHTQPLALDPALVEGVELEHVEITPISEAFKPMCRELAFDIAEMSITGYLLARVYDKGFTALPIFPVRAFGSSHGSVVGNSNAGVRVPCDLEGKKAGARAYSGAASFWARAVLMHEFGLDPAAVTWISADEEHVLEYQQDAPHNAHYQPGADLNAMLLDGELAAGIGLSARAPHLSPLIPDPRDAALAWYRRSGVYQINHTVVVRDALLVEYPALGLVLCRAFAGAKHRWLSGSPDLSSTSDLDLPGGDPFPYGIGPNLTSLQALLQYAAEQQILPRTYTLQELFPIDAT
jgi:4,5-dihydroxyphthalate decarboxylase